MTDPGGTPAIGGLRSVQHVSPTQQVREQLLAAIERGDFAPGAMLPSERALCATFGVSRVSVREAIAGLEAMGLITVQQGRGAFVREGVAGRYAGPFGKYLQLHRAELVELLKVRGALDELTAEEAALHGSAADLAKVVEACQQFSAAVETDPHDLAKLAEFDVAFHMSIAEAAGGELLPEAGPRAERAAGGVAADHAGPNRPAAPLGPAAPGDRRRDPDRGCRRRAARGQPACGSGSAVAAAGQRP